jgi:2'-5' RNA ligase
MIKLKLLLEGKYEYGCLMANIVDEHARKILDLNYDLIDEKSLYKKGSEYGRESQCHVTIKYGFTKSYSDSEMKKHIKSIKPFKINTTRISIFENDDFDVVKLDVSSKILHDLNEKFSELPNEDEHPKYHPHITLAYVKKGMGKNL